MKQATSVLDFVFRDLAINYLGRNDLAHVDAPVIEHHRWPPPPLRSRPWRRRCLWR